MKTYTKKQKIFYILLPFIAIFIVFIIGKLAVYFKEYLPSCYSYEVLHIYCPGCGSTRAVFALLEGDILLSLRQNFLPIIYILAGTWIYIEFLFKVFEKKPPFSIMKMKYFWALVAVAAVYSILRNFIPAIAPI